MTKETFDKYMDLILSMTVDVKMGGISSETYLSNIKTMITDIENQLIGKMK